MLSLPAAAISTFLYLHLSSDKYIYTYCKYVPMMVDGTSVYVLHEFRTPLIIVIIPTKVECTRGVPRYFIYDELRMRVTNHVCDHDREPPFVFLFFNHLSRLSGKSINSLLPAR